MVVPSEFARFGYSYWRISDEKVEVSNKDDNTISFEYTVLSKKHVDALTLMNYLLGVPAREVCALSVVEANGGDVVVVGVNILTHRLREKRRKILVECGRLKLRTYRDARIAQDDLQNIVPVHGHAIQQFSEGLCLTLGCKAIKVFTCLQLALAAK